jgi:TPR repeat protein
MLALFCALYAGAASPAVSAEKREPKEYALACNELKCGHCTFAHQHLEKLAQHGHAKSQTLLALMYQEGATVKKDSKQAAHWFEQAAQQGLKEAEYGLGHLYMSGEESIRDPEQAEKWLTRAAEHGVVDAQRELGQMLLLKGDLAGKDHDMAVRWLKRAASHGSVEARKRLDQIPGSDKVEDVIAQGENELHQGGQAYGQGLSNIEQSWEGYGDLAKSIHDAAGGTNTGNN